MQEAIKKRLEDWNEEKLCDLPVSIKEDPQLSAIAQEMSETTMPLDSRTASIALSEVAEMLPLPEHCIERGSEAIRCTERCRLLSSVVARAGWTLVEDEAEGRLYGNPCAVELHIEGSSST